MSYNSELQSNNAELEEILEQAKALPNAVGDAVLYTPQELSEEKQTQARSNIGAQELLCWDDTELVEICPSKNFTDSCVIIDEATPVIPVGEYGEGSFFVNFDGQIYEVSYVYSKGNATSLEGDVIAGTAPNAPFYVFGYYGGYGNAFRVEIQATGDASISHYVYACGYTGELVPIPMKFVPTDARPLIVAIFPIKSASGDYLGYLSSHTGASIKEAHSAGRIVVVEFEYTGILVRAPLIGVLDDNGVQGAVFGCTATDPDSGTPMNVQVIVVTQGIMAVANVQITPLAGETELQQAVANMVSLESREYTADQQKTVRDNIDAAQSPFFITLTEQVVGEETQYVPSHSMSAIIESYEFGRRMMVKVDLDGNTVLLPFTGVGSLSGTVGLMFAGAIAVTLSPVRHSNIIAVIHQLDDGTTAAMVQFDPLATLDDIPSIPTFLPNPWAMRIGSKNYTGSGFVDFTDTINGMIDEKIPENPETLPNPNTLTINGVSYDGSKSVSVDELATETYVDNKIAAIPTPDVSGQINTHNVSTDAHNDIRLLLEELSARLNALADCDDTTLAQMREMVADIQSNEDLIDSITTSKVNVADIIDNLLTNVSDKPLSAAQGVALKKLIDSITVPKKVSELTNDKGYLTSYTETDPTVPAWAKAATKPSYTAKEVGALPSSTTIPGTIADLAEDPDHRSVTDAEKAAWNAKSDFSGSYTDLTNKPAKLPNPNALTINGESYDGSKAVEVHTHGGKSVYAYGAKGDGVTDDTAAFQNALAGNRVVFVPGGTYKLSGTLVIRENCCLGLSQDTILEFTQTSGDCIEMRSSAVLRGNHGMICVPYAFTGNVISMDTSQDGTNHNSIPPNLHAGSHMFKRQRFVYDINILKPDANGICKSTDGTCTGTAIYMHCLGSASFRWMWAITMSGVRIAGGFSYGIRAYNIDKSGDYEDNAWNHDMRIEAVIENCEIGVALENCNGAHLAVTIQPHATESGVTYAKHGIYLNDARYVDLIGSRVWDWDANGTRWTAGGQYQHIALIGNCRGLLLDDFLCSESSSDIRDLIYTDTPGNFDAMSVLQEAGGKNFKAVDGAPYFENKGVQQKLVTQDVMDAHFQTDMVKRFTDVLPAATDGSGNIFGGKGYVKSGYNIGSDGKISANVYYGCTGFIPIKPGDTVYVYGIVLGAGDGSSNFCLYNSSFTKLANMNSANAQFQAGTNYYYHYTALENGFKVVVAPNYDPTAAAYLRFSYLSNMVKDTPMVSINKEIKYEYEGFLAGGIKVNGEEVLLTSPGGKTFTLKVADDGTLTTEPLAT